MCEVTHDVQLEPQLHPLSSENLHSIQDDDASGLSASGGAYTIILFLMSGISTALQSLIVLLHWRLFFKSMNWRNFVLMRSVFGGWSMEVLPPFFSTSGGMGRAAYKHFTRLLSEKWSSPYTVVMGCSLGFSLLHSSIMCIRGLHSRSKHPCVPPAVDLAVAEGHLPAH